MPTKSRINFNGRSTWCKRMPYSQWTREKESRRQHRKSYIMSSNDIQFVIFKRTQHATHAFSSFYLFETLNFRRKRKTPFLRLHVMVKLVVAVLYVAKHTSPISCGNSSFQNSMFECLRERKGFVRAHPDTEIYDITFWFHQPYFH